jgi:hypothetical protein
MGLHRECRPDDDAIAGRPDYATFVLVPGLPTPHADLPGRRLPTSKSPSRSSGVVIGIGPNRPVPDLVPEVLAGWSRAMATSLATTAGCAVGSSQLSAADGALCGASSTAGLRSQSCSRRQAQSRGSLSQGGVCAQREIDFDPSVSRRSTASAVRAVESERRPQEADRDVESACRTPERC